MSKPRVWFITGAASGFGRALTEHILSIGEIAVATDLSTTSLAPLASSYPSSNLLILPCDVSNPFAISFAFMRMKETFGRCDVVFNNAGVAIAGEVESTPDAMARKLMEVNFWGSLNVSKEAVKFFREVNEDGQGGTLFVTASAAGSDPTPLLGFYSASGFVALSSKTCLSLRNDQAVESITEVLSKELHPAWNIRVVILEPGGFKTNLEANTPRTEVHPAYTDPSMLTQQVRKVIADIILLAQGDPKKAAIKFVEFADAIERDRRRPRKARSAAEVSGKANGNGASNEHEEEILPLKWTVGKDGIQQLRARMDAVKRDLNLSERYWSDNLAVDTVPAASLIG